jgi:hypothetical protein
MSSLRHIQVLENEKTEVGIEKHMKNYGPQVFKTGVLARTQGQWGKKKCEAGKVGIYQSSKNC